jgi:peptidyl-prolyl cis-trans isomerase D
MMQGLRDNMKIIIWITAIIFLVGFGVLELGGVLDFQGARGAGNGPAGVIAEINGQPIRYEVFQQTYNQMVNQLQQSRQLQEGEDSYIREQAWQEIVRNTLLAQEAKKRGISVSPDEIKNAVRYTPPQFLAEAEPFQTNGQFDYRKYSAELDNPNSQVPWGQVEAVVAAQLPLQKLQEQVVSAAQVSDGDVRDRFLLQNERLTLRYLRFAPDSFPIDTTQIGGADIESYYKAHLEDFTGPEEAKLEISLVPRLPDASDFSAAKERLLPIWEEVKAAPDSFESRAKVYSDIQSNVRGGALPAPTPFDDLRPLIRQGLQDVPAGQISGIIQEERSLHMFRVNSRRIDPATNRDMIHYNEIAIRVLPGASAIRSAREKVDEYITDATKNGLAAAATKRGYRSSESQWFSLGKSQNEVFQRFPDIETWVFSAKIGSVSRPIPSEFGWYVYEIADRRDAGPRPLDKISADVKKALVRSLQMQRAAAAAEQARAAIAAGEKEEAVASRFKAMTGRADGVTRNGFIGPLGQDARMVGQLLAMQAGEWTPVLQGKPGAVVFHIDGRTVPSEEEFTTMAPEIRQTLMTERQRVLFIEWMQDLRRKAKVKDYRENFFDA